MAILVFLGVMGVVVLLVKRTLTAVEQFRSMQAIERAEAALQLQEAEYAQTLGLACQNFRVSSNFVSESLQRIQEILDIRRDKLKHERKLVEAGDCSAERDAELMATAWNDEIGQRVCEIKRYFADFSAETPLLAA